MSINPQVKKAVELCGGQTGLARACRVRQQVVWKWLRMKSLPADKAVAVEAATNGAVRVEQLCPNVHWHVIRKSE